MDILFEIGFEELPALQVGRLVLDSLTEYLSKANIAYGDIGLFHTNRRIGVLIRGVVIPPLIKKGPIVLLKDWMDNDNLFITKFLQGVGIRRDEIFLSDPRGKEGQVQLCWRSDNSNDLLVSAFSKSLSKLPAPLYYNGYHCYRPVKWVVFLCDDKIIDFECYKVASGRTTYGHRFLAPGPISLESPLVYEKSLEEAFVIADVKKREDFLLHGLAKASPFFQITEPQLSKLVMSFEYPRALLCHFDDRFLSLPVELLKTVIEQELHSVAVVEDKKLLPQFIYLCNSCVSSQVSSYNRLVMDAKLEDAILFYQKDMQQSIYHYADLLKKESDLYEQSVRVGKLAVVSSPDFEVHGDVAYKTAMLMKVDRLTSLVFEYPSLNGTVGKYLALNSGESTEVAQAIEESYFPRFAGDEVPRTSLGCLLSFADKLDALCSMSASLRDMKNKDPFALRRSAIGVLRILMVRTDLSISQLVSKIASLYPKMEVSSLEDFLCARLSSLYADYDHLINKNVCLKTLNTKINFLKSVDPNILERSKMIRKRILNLRANFVKDSIDISLLIAPEEQALFSHLSSAEINFDENFLHRSVSLTEDFLDNVTVLSNDVEIKNNRSALLNKALSLLS